MNKEALRRRYTYLWTGEAVAASVGAALLLWFAAQDGMWQHWIARTYSAGVVILILGQGVVWWRWKLYILQRNQRHLPAPLLTLFEFWRRVNWLLISAFPLVVIIVPPLVGQPLGATDTWLGLLMLGGAVLEQVNYYYVQLMYDSTYDWTYLYTHRHLRRGTIARALDAHPEHKYG